MKILAFSPYPPSTGGGAKATLEIFKRLNDEIDLVTYGKESFPLKHVKVYHFNILGNTTMFKGFQYIIKGFFRAIKLCKNNKYDVIYVKNLTSPGIIGYFISKKFNIPMVVHTSGPDVEDLDLLSKNYGYFGSIYKLITKFFVKRILHSAKKIIANGVIDKRCVKKISGRNSIVIYNGVDHKTFNVIKKNTKEVKCIFVGRAAEEKNIPALLKAANEIPNLKFLFVGPTKQDLEKFGSLSDNIIPLGNQKKVYKLLQKADIFLLPSFGEGTSNAMLEAMSVGLPVIVYPAGESKILIKNGLNGYVVDNVKDFILRIKELSNNKQLRNLMGENNRKLILEKFDWDKCVKEFREVLFSK